MTFAKPGFIHKKTLPPSALNPIPEEALPVPLYLEPVMTLTGEIMTAISGDIMMQLIEIDLD